VSGAPLEAAEVAARRIADAIGKLMPKGWGFIVWLMKHGPDGHMTYLSSISPDTAIAALEEWIAREKANPESAAFRDETGPSCWCCGGSKTLVTLRGPKRSVDVCAQCILSEEPWTPDDHTKSRG
jgi:hypothetical protein